VTTDPPTDDGQAALSDLYQYEGKAELIAGRIVCYPHLGCRPGHAVLEIMSSLDRFVKAAGLAGEVFGPGLIYAIPPLPNGRQSFCPDGSYYDGPLPANLMSWVEGPPTFAVEIRRLDDFRTEFDPARADKRSDYFAAGTLAVWDVDPVTDTVTLYRAADPTAPVVFRLGDTADAEPAVPGWRLKVDDLFA
jgi:hypothetical protein